MLATVAEQAGLSLTWSETPEDTFSHDEAHLIVCLVFSFLHCASIAHEDKNKTRDGIVLPVLY